MVIMIAVTTVFVAYVMLQRRGIQPLKKKSPGLMIISAVGHFLVIFNIGCCLVCFEGFKIQQSKCYFENGYINADNYQLGDKCMADWVQSKKFVSWFADLNGYMILCFSEMLAIVPYLLRSLRI